MKIKYLSSILKNDFNKNVLNIFSGGVISNGILFLFSPLLTRLFDPKDFAYFGVFLTSTIILNEILSFKFENLLYNHPKGKNYFLIIYLIISFLYIFLILAFLGIFVLFEFGYSENLPLYGLIILGTTFLGLFKILFILNNLKGFQTNISKGRIFRAILTILFSVAFSFKGIHSYGLIIGFIAGQIIEIIILNKKVSIIPFLNPRKLRLYRLNIWEISKTHKDYSYVFTFSSLINRLNFELPTLIIPLLYGAPQLGQFTQAKRAGNAITVITNSFSEIFKLEVSKNILKNKSNSQLFISTRKKLSIISLILFLILIVIYFFYLEIFDHKWDSAKNLFLILIPFHLLTTLVSPLSGILVIKQKFNKILIFQSISFLIFSLGIFLTYLFNLNISFLIGLYALGLIIKYVFEYYFSLKEAI